MQFHRDKAYETQTQHISISVIINSLQGYKVYIKSHETYTKYLRNMAIEDQVSLSDTYSYSHWCISIIVRYVLQSQQSHLYAVPQCKTSNLKHVPESFRSL